MAANTPFEMPAAGFMPQNAVAPTPEMDVRLAPTGILGRIRHIGQTVVNAAAMGAIGYELNHGSNEGSRAWILGRVQEATHNSALATTACVAATFAIEVGAALGAARLLHTKLGDRVLSWAGVRQDVPPTEQKAPSAASRIWGAVAPIVVGTPYTVLRGNLRHPGRTLADDVKVGLEVGTAVTAVTAVPEYFGASPLVEAWNWVSQHIGSETATIGSLAFTGIIGVGTIINQRRKWRRLSEEVSP